MICMDILKNKTSVIISVIVLLALLVGIIFLYKGKPRTDEISQNTQATTMDIDLIGVTATSGPVKKDGYTIEMTPPTQKKQVLPKTPSLDRAIPETPTLSSEVRTALLTNITRVVANLRANPKSYADWLGLGALRQTLGDYAGAAEAWNYAVALAPNTGVAYANLGYLYAHYIKDYPKAELNYLKGIANDARAVNTYRNLVDLYTYSYKQTTTAVEDLLKKGIKANPKAIDLQVLLARHYKSSGRIAEANTAYDSAIKEATAQKNSNLAAELTVEKSAK